MVKSVVTTSFVFVHFALLSQISVGLPVRTTQQSGTLDPHSLGHQSDEPLHRRELLEVDKRSGAVGLALKALPWVGGLGALTLLGYHYLSKTNNSSSPATSADATSKDAASQGGPVVSKRSLHYFEERDWNELESRTNIQELDELD